MQECRCCHQGGKPRPAAPVALPPTPQPEGSSSSRADCRRFRSFSQSLLDAISTSRCSAGGTPTWLPEAVCGPLWADIALPTTAHGRMATPQPKARAAHKLPRRML